MPGTNLPHRPAGSDAGDDAQGPRWNDLYADGRPPPETGIGAAAVHRRRRHRLIGWLTALAVLVAAGIGGFFAVPKWWYSPTAYMDHLGYGPYEGEMPQPLRSQLGATLPGLISFVEKTRGQRFDGQPKVVFLPDTEFRQELSSHAAFAQWHYVGSATYDALGWAHVGDSFDVQTLDLHGQDVVGYYGDWDGNIYLRGTRLTPLADAELVRLLTESLDDQTFNLAALYDFDKADFDERTTYDALVAGDTRWVEQRYIDTRPLPQRCALEDGANLPADAACAARGQHGGVLGTRNPLQAEIHFADNYGLRFAAELRAAGGNAAVDAAFRNPPRSTADILSLAHYRMDRGYELIDYPPHPGKLVDFGSLGAYTLSLLLVHGQPAQVPGHEVSGWRGDRFSTATVGAKTCVYDSVVFDSTAQASGFVDHARAAGLTAAGPKGALHQVSLTVCH